MSDGLIALCVGGLVFLAPMIIYLQIQALRDEKRRGVRNDLVQEQVPHLS